MKRGHVILVIGITMVSIATAGLVAQSTKKIDSEGIANMIFASAAIGKGQEGSAALKDSFTSGDAIYARCYFPGAIGAFSRGEKCHLHLWIDGKVAWRGVYSGASLPDRTWDQIQIYIRNTGEDDFRGAISNALDGLAAGDHEVQFVIVRDKFLKYKVVKKGAQVTQEPVYQPVNLSKGKFTYTVQ